ncbi:hypothetical protein B7486_73715, partial [cyanobacterium TDX16]
MRLSRRRPTSRALGPDDGEVASLAPQGTDATRLLRDDVLQRRLDEDGYVVVPLLTPHEVEDLRALWDEIRPEAPPSAVVSSVNLLDPAANQEVEQRIRRVLEPHAAA